MTKKPICPICEKPRRVGNCDFGQGGADMGPHCRSCCAAPLRDKWRAARPASKPAAVPAKRRA